MARVEVVFAAVEAAEDTAGLADDQAAGGDVPGLEAGFPEGIETSRGDIAQVDRGGARTPDAGGAAEHLVQHREVGTHLLAGAAEREAGTDERLGQLVAAADAYAPAVELCAVAARCGEEFLAHRVVDDAVFHAAFDLYADRDGEYRETVQEIRRAVERVDDPDGLRFPLHTAFLCEDGVVGIVLVDDLDHGAFRGAIGVADVIVVAFLLDLQLVEVGQVAHQRTARAPRGHHCHIE